MPRFRMVKNITFFWDGKKLFLTYWKTVFWVTEHFCRKWTFWKNVIFCPKNAFFWQKWQFDPLPRAAPRRGQWTFLYKMNFSKKCLFLPDVKELFFLEVILNQFLKRKNRALLSKNVQAILTLLNLTQKVPFLEDLKKKVSESDWNQRHIVYVTQIHYYTLF